MEIEPKYSIRLGNSVGRENLSKGLWIIITHAKRLPPHVGMLFNGQYSSLNVVGREEDIALPTVLRSVDIKKKASIYVKVKPHPVFSVDFLREHFLHELRQHDCVTELVTCFAPVRSFMRENYLLQHKTLDYLYQLFPVMYAEGMIEAAFGENLDDKEEFCFRPYNQEDFKRELNAARKLNLIND